MKDRFRPNEALLNLVSSQDKFNTANLSFLANLNTLEDIKYAHKMCFNLLAKKKITPALLKQLFDGLGMYAKLIREMSITDISARLVELDQDARKICQIHSLPVNVREEKIQEDDRVDTSFYGSALRRLQLSDDSDEVVIDYDDD
jgi:hypothetical protein